MIELIYDVHASESGALAILDDLYNKIMQNEDKTIQYIFAVSTPEYEDAENIKVLRYPWVKKSWFHRLYFNSITTRKILREYKPTQVYSLQNEGISFFKGTQKVYLHLPFVLCDYKFGLYEDGIRLWIYQNIFSKSIFSSLRQVDEVIVQTSWMKEALVKKAGVCAKHITVEAPDISTNQIGEFQDIVQNRRRFFYPATAFNYKNHMTLLKAIKYAVEKGLTEYEVVFTIRKDENLYTEKLFDYVIKNSLNVYFNGPLSRSDVFQMYTRSVLLFPSFVESFGLPLLEARKSETYVIASDCPFSREILDGYDKAEFFEAMNFKKMGDFIFNIAMQ